MNSNQPQNTNTTVPQIRDVNGKLTAFPFDVITKENVKTWLNWAITTQTPGSSDYGILVLVGDNAELPKMNDGYKAIQLAKVGNETAYGIANSGHHWAQIAVQLVGFSRKQSQAAQWLAQSGEAMSVLYDYKQATTSSTVELATVVPMTLNGKVLSMELDLATLNNGKAIVVSIEPQPSGEMAVIVRPSNKIIVSEDKSKGEKQFRLVAPIAPTAEQETATEQPSQEETAEPSQETATQETA